MDSSQVTFRKGDTRTMNGGIENPAFEEDPPAGPSKSKTEENSPPKNEGNVPLIGNYQTDVDDHRIALDELAQRYNTNFTKGLTDIQVSKNRDRWGRNELIPPEKPSLLFKFMKELFAGLNILLWACAILALGAYGSQYIFGDSIYPDYLILGVLTIIVIVVSAMFAFYQQFKSDRIMESFKNMTPRAAKVLRNGRSVSVEVADLVVGDVVEIRYGDLIPADIRILEAQEFKVDNSGLTGESDPIKLIPACTKPEDPLETRNLAFFSTSAVEGHCKGLVFRVGSNTFMGQVAALASHVHNEKTPIGKEMDSFIRVMTIRSLLFGTTFFIIAKLMHYSTLDAIFFVIGIVVANVPEGVCVAFTMILALTAKRMAKKNCLVKTLHAVETLGSTSVICTDKTGTLTQNKMSVAHLWFNDEIAEADTSAYKTGASFFHDDPGFKALFRVAALCSRAVFKPGQENVPVHSRVVEGDASESAILRYMEHQHPDIVKYRNKYPRLAEIPFTSENKYHVSIHDMRDPKDPRYLLVMKGAPERIMGFCKSILIGDEEYEMTPGWIEQYNHVYTTLGSFGERVLGFCDCRLPADKYPIGYEFNVDENPEFLTEGFRFVGLISLVDPPRPSVPGAVAKCRSAGIKVVMVTGDHPLTAAAIARAVGIITPGNRTIEEIAQSSGRSVEDVNPRQATAAVITGAELKMLKPEQLQNIMNYYKEIVFARTSPEQKYMIVEAFQGLGHIVASTGDGVNDSPALKKADIGVAMGISGTEVSKETADMILMDDNFASIVTGVEEGRLIFDNLKKLITYMLSDNIAEMYSVWIFIMLKCPLPMGTIAMLLSVVGTDVPPAISIAYEKPESDIMKLRPRNPYKDKLVTPQLLSYSYGQSSVLEVTSGFFTYFVCMAMQGFWPRRLVGIRTAWESNAVNDLQDSYGQEWTYNARMQLGYQAQTAFFVSIVMTQVANIIVCKTRRASIFQKGLDNWHMNVAILIEIGLLMFFVYTPTVNSTLLLAAVPKEVYLAPIPFMLLMLLWGEVRTYFVRTSGQGWFATEMYA